MSKRTISILGCGWLGKPLGSALVRSGFLVRGSTTRSENIPSIQAAGIAPVVLKVGHELSDDSTGEFFNAELLIISLPQRARAGKAEEYQNQIQKVIQAAQRGKISNIIMISTTSVYQNLNRVVTEEDADPANPIVKAENVLRESGIPCTILRFGGLVGPGRHPGRFLAGKRDVAGAKVPVNIIHLDDCIGIIMRIIEDDVWNVVLNACADDHPVREQFYTDAALAIGLQPPVFSAERDADFKIVSNERLKEVLRYQFIYKLNEPIV